MKRSSFHTRSFRRIHLSVFRYRWTKNGFTGPKVFGAFEKRTPGPFSRHLLAAILPVIWCVEVSLLCTSFHSREIGKLYSWFLNAIESSRTLWVLLKDFRSWHGLVQFNDVPYYLAVQMDTCCKVASCWQFLEGLFHNCTHLLFVILGCPSHRQ